MVCCVCAWSCTVYVCLPVVQCMCAYFCLTRSFACLAGVRGFNVCSIPCKKVICNRNVWQDEDNKIEWNLVPNCQSWVIYNVPLHLKEIPLPHWVVTLNRGRLLLSMYMYLLLPLTKGQLFINVATISWQIECPYKTWRGTTIWVWLFIYGNSQIIC